MLLHLRDVAADRGRIEAAPGHGQDRRTGDDPVRENLGEGAVRGTVVAARADALPAIASLRDGGFMVWPRPPGQGSARPVAADRARPHDARGVRRVWDGGLISMARRAGLADVARRFGIGWFMGAIHKYRRLLGEVLVASFFLQLFGLISPLFFQVVIDKVLVHRSAPSTCW